jgi:hypothetical protein
MKLFGDGKALRLAAAAMALVALSGAAQGFSAAEWQVIERQTDLLAPEAGTWSGRAAACHLGDAARRRQDFYDFLLRYLAADAASARLEEFDRAAAAAARAPCDRYLLERARARARAERAKIEPILRDHGS